MDQITFDKSIYFSEYQRYWNFIPTHRLYVCVGDYDEYLNTQDLIIGIFNGNKDLDWNIDNSGDFIRFSKDEYNIFCKGLFINRFYHNDTDLIVTHNELDIIYNKLVNISSFSSIPTKSGGKCSVCGFNDDYASLKDNKYYCYRHTPGY
jgi:hypothetical protein